jgi:hypothetical protein
MTAPENFCKFLKNGLVYNNDTNHFVVSPCCYFSKNYTIDPASNPEQQLADYKQQWLTEDFSNTCKICLDAESSGLTSYRQASFDEIPGDYEQLNFLTIAVNKKCNLACASCDSNSSSFWYQENLRHNVQESNHIIQLHREDREGIITEKFLSTLASQDLSKVTYIKFGGGEPLMSDTHEKILNLFSHPEKITIQYTSNFSLMPTERVFKLWEKFKLIKWVASLDGVGDQFSFLRWPYSWKNLEKFIENAKANVPGNVMFGVEHTINLLNAFYYTEFKTWMEEHFNANRFGDPSDLNLHKCHGLLSVDHMPPNLQNLVKNKLGDNHAVSMMIDQSTYSNNITPTIQYLDQLDQWRNLSWRSLFPEIQEYLNA